MSDNLTKEDVVRFRILELQHDIEQLNLEINETGSVEGRKWRIEKIKDLSNTILINSAMLNILTGKRPTLH